MYLTVTRRAVCSIRNSSDNDVKADTSRLVFKFVSREVHFSSFNEIKTSKRLRKKKWWDSNIRNFARNHQGSWLHFKAGSLGFQTLPTSFLGNDFAPQMTLLLNQPRKSDRKTSALRSFARKRDFFALLQVIRKLKVSSLKCFSENWAMFFCMCVFAHCAYMCAYEWTDVHIYTSINAYTYTYT